MKEILFKYCGIKPFKKQWGVFTLECNDKSYVFLITRNGNKGNFLNIPMWTNGFKKDKVSSSLNDCKQLAKNYDKFCDNSEWF